jgi:hypothetical protein
MEVGATRTDAGSADHDFFDGLMRPIRDRGKMAPGIAPPARGRVGSAADDEYAAVG